MIPCNGADQESCAVARLFLGVYAVLFAGFGAFMFMNPHVLVENLGAAGMGSNGLYELRSNYGGVSVGIGLACLAGALKRTFERPALFVLLAYTGGYALGRVAALPFDGVPTANLIGYAVFEAVTAALAAALLARSGSRASSRDG